MTLCVDPAISYLKEYGYSVIRLPRRDFPPLQILAGNGGDLNSLGELATVMVPGPNAKLPPIRTDNPAAAISGKRTSDLSLGIGLSIIGSVISAMGGGKLGLDAKYKHAKSLAFEFADVKADEVRIAELDQFLSASDINPASKYVGSLLEADEIYVVTSIIKSTKFNVEAKNSNGTEVEVNIPEIKEVVGGNVKVSASAERASKVTYEGNVPLVFGFQAVKLFYENGHYQTVEPLEAGEIATRALSQAKLPAGVKAFSSEGPFARVKAME